MCKPSPRRVLGPKVEEGRLSSYGVAREPLAVTQASTGSGPAPASDLHLWVRAKRSGPAWGQILQGKQPRASPCRSLRVEKGGL